MKYIDEPLIYKLLQASEDPPASQIEEILAKSRELKRLELAETATLLKTENPQLLQRIYETALQVKNAVYGKRIVLFAPLYISNYCCNNCLYCGFRTSNREAVRTFLTPAQIGRQTELLLQQGHMRVLMVAGEAAPPGHRNIDYFTEGVRAVYDASWHSRRIRRVNINLPPMPVEELRIIARAGVGTYQVFQETYHEETYRNVHRGGPKSDPDRRISAFDNAIEAGMEDIGMGVLYGLYDWKFETLAMLMHVEHLEKTWGIGPHTISVPRLQEAQGSAISRQVPFPVTDGDMKKLVAALRLSVPYTGMILSTREEAGFRDELLRLGISQLSAGSSVTPGGYGSENQADQFELHDSRNLDEITDSLISAGFIPSFCAACYRKSRTGRRFMDLARPGDIKRLCQINALATLKEYTADYGNEALRQKGDALIEQYRSEMAPSDSRRLESMLESIEKGERDIYC